MGALQAPQQFSPPGVMQPAGRPNTLMPAEALPPMPQHPSLMPFQLNTPTYAAPNATPSPILPGKNNDAMRARYLNYPQPGGFGGGYRGPSLMGS